MTDPTAIPAQPVAPPAPPRRARPGVLPIAAVVLATLLLGAALVFLFGAYADRDDANTERREAAAQLRRARDRAEEAKSTLSTTQAAHRKGMTLVASVTAPYDGLVALADREVELAAGLRDAGANNADDRVDEYNDLLSRGNEVVDQYNALVRQLDELIAHTIPDTTKTF